MSNLLHCDIGEVVQYLREQNKVFYADRLSDCLRHSNENLVKLTIENQKLRKELEEMRKDRDELRCEVCDWVGNHFKEPPQDVAKRNGWDCFDTGVWDCFKENTND